MAHKLSLNAAGSSTSSFASASGLSRTMAMSISPPSLRIIVGRPACISARIATALFSHKVRSHSSRALCARVSVCSGAFRAAGVPNARRKGLSGGMGMGNAEWPLRHVERHLFVHHMTWSFSCLWQARSQPIVAPVYILVSVPYTFGSTLHDGTIEARHG